MQQSESHLIWSTFCCVYAVFNSTINSVTDLKQFAMTHYSLIQNYPYGTYGNGSRCITSFGASGDGGDDLNWPWYCDVNNVGDFVIADTMNNRIQTFQTSTYRASLQPYYGSEKFPLFGVKSVKSSGIPGTNLVVANTDAQEVCLLRADYAKGEINLVNSFGKGFFQEPTDVCVQRGTGNIVVVDTCLHQVSIHTQSGMLLGFCQQDNFNMSQPSAVAISPTGDIFVSDTGNNCLRQFKCNGQYVATIGKIGSFVGEFNGPRGIAFDQRGYMFVADEFNNRIQMISPDLRHFTNAVTNLPLPKGVAANKNLLVTAAASDGFAKVYHP